MANKVRARLWRIRHNLPRPFSAAQAGVLPEDRADVLYFRYDGGGVEISGPSMLVRKSIGEHVSVAANYYIDMVSSASIDVETSASPYEDERTQSSLAVDYLHGKSTYSSATSTATKATTRPRPCSPRSATTCSAT